MKKENKIGNHAELVSASSSYLFNKENTFMNNNREAGDPECPQGGPNFIMKQKAFTLIELLVVVLIIGILAAIAVPQYKMAVAKSQYATVKQLAASIKNAQEVYYMANGQYAAKLDDLDVNFPASDDERNTDTAKYYKNGTCFITSSQSICNVKTAIGTLGYQVWYDHSGKVNMRSCVAFNTDLTSSTNKFCKAETGSNNFGQHEDQNYTLWWEK